MQVACADYKSVGSVPTEDDGGDESTTCDVVYGDMRFHLVTATPSPFQTAFWKALNAEPHLRLILDVKGPTVSNLLDIDVTKFQFLLAASEGRLRTYLPQIRALQCKHNERLHETLRGIFKQGAWKHMKCKENLYLTFHSALQLSGTLEKGVSDFFNESNNNNNSTSNIPFYVIRSLSFPFYFIHAYKPNKYTVYKIDEDDLNVIQECIDLTNVISSYDAVALLQHWTVKNDIDLVVHMAYMCHKKLKESNTNVYRHLLQTFKDNLHSIAKTYYNIIIPEDLALGILDYSTGESMVTEMIQVQLLSKRKPNAITESWDVVQHLTDSLLTLSSHMKPLSLQDGCVLFINQAELHKPALYVYRGERASKLLSEIIFNVWIGTTTNNAGFLLLPTEKSHELPMETDYATMPSHCLALVATEAIREFRPSLPVKIYGSVIQNSTLCSEMSQLQTMLINWFTDPGSLKAHDISYVITQHTSAVLKFASPQDSRLFDPSFTSLTKLTNSLSYRIPDTLLDQLLLGSKNLYGSLQVTNDQFITLFNNKG